MISLKNLKSLLYRPSPAYPQNTLNHFPKSSSKYEKVKFYSGIALGTGTLLQLRKQKNVTLQSASLTVLFSSIAFSFSFSESISSSLKTKGLACKDIDSFPAKTFFFFSAKIFNNKTIKLRK